MAISTLSFCMGNNAAWMKNLFNYLLAVTILAAFLLTGCSTASPAPAPATETSRPPTEKPALPTETPTAQLTPTPPGTETPLPTPTQILVRSGPGIVHCTILLYHHVAISPIESQYYVHPDKFAEQMQALDDWGFTPIPLSLLVKAITEGAELPLKPVVISFDDGRLNIYENAFPIMQQHGFSGIFYILSGGLNDPTLVDAAMLQEMVAAGWEIGSHSRSHADLSAISAEDSYEEVVSSRFELESDLGIPITSFAYPFGTMTNLANEQVHMADYESAVGLGYTDSQGPGNLFYLQRRPISWDYDLKRFALVLGWDGPLYVKKTSEP